ncbi:unnamed protein product, partial [Rotaria magnacalcarata]
SNSDSVDMLDLMLLSNTRTMLSGQELDDDIHGGHFRNEDNFQNYYSSNEADNANLSDEILLLHDSDLLLC